MLLTTGFDLVDSPVRPVVTPPQYTVQLLGLDWFTTSSKDNCLVLVAKRRKGRKKHTGIETK